MSNFEAMSLPDRPQQKLPAFHLFEVTNESRNGQLVQTGFKDPEGNHYTLADGEELIGVKEGGERKAYIRTTDGREISFDLWKQGK